VQDTVGVIRVNRTPQCNTATWHRKGSAVHTRSGLSPFNRHEQRHMEAGRDARIGLVPHVSRPTALPRDLIFAALPTHANELFP